MKKLIFALTLAAITWPTLAAAEDGTGGDPNDMRVFWDRGVRFETADGRFKYRLGADVQADLSFFTNNDQLEAVVGDIDDGFRFRRARIALAGVLYSRFIFTGQFDFARGEVELDDVFMGIRDAKFAGTLRVGHFKEPFSLEEQTYSQFSTFLERGLPNALVPGRNVGFGMQNDFIGERVTLGFGLFWESDETGDSVGDNVNFTLRGTALAWDGGDDRLFHVGFGWSRRDPDGGFLRVASRPEANKTPFFVDTGTPEDPSSPIVTPPDPPDGTGQLPYAPADLADLFGFEAALMLGPFSLQGEYIQTVASNDRGILNNAVTGNIDFPGYYVFASYFITGEHRTYNRHFARFQGVEPKAKAFTEGAGAWEVAIRYSNLDASDSGVRGGKLQDGTLGVNWYLNYNTRVMFNYIYSSLEDKNGFSGSEDIHSFQLRFQVNI